MYEDATVLVCAVMFREYLSITGVKGNTHLSGSVVPSLGNIVVQVRFGVPREHISGGWSPAEGFFRLSLDFE